MREADARIAKRLEGHARDTRTLVAEERRIRQNEAVEQRRYVDDADAAIVRELRDVTRRSFFGRLRWLFRGQ